MATCGDYYFCVIIYSDHSIWLWLETFFGFYYWRTCISISSILKIEKINELLDKKIVFKAET